MGCAAELMEVEEVMWVEYSNTVTKILGNLEINKKMLMNLLITVVCIQEKNSSGSMWRETSLW